MAANAQTLDDHQRFVLMKFRRNVNDILLPHHDEKFLLRWLRARSWNPEAAEKMLRQSMKWRQQWDVDGALKSWDPPENFCQYYTCGATGFDKNGSPVIVVPFGNLDIVGILHAFGKQVFIKMTIKTLEGFLQLAAEKGGHKVVAIFDMEGFNLRPYVWRPAAEVIVAMVKMYEANYPEILSACYIINAPHVFAIAFNAIKRFLNEYTLGKIHIFKSDPKKWQKAILQDIEPDNLPRHYGGSLTDPDGNPKYTSVVTQGGKVPKHLYKKHCDLNADGTSMRQYTTTAIKKGDKLSLDFIVAEEGSFLKWDFRTEGHDIRFGINMKNGEDKDITVIPHARVASHQINETGVIACQAPATYTVTFDNSYSIMRGKKIHYEIVITPPLEQFGILPENEGTTDELATTSTH